MPKRLEIPDELVGPVVRALENHAAYLDGYRNDGRLKYALPALLEQLKADRKPAGSEIAAPVNRKKTG